MIDRNLKKEVIFIDQTSQHDHHMVFNASILKILLRIFQTPITYYGIETSINSVNQLLNKVQKENINPKNIIYTKPVFQNLLGKKLNYVRKEITRYKSFKHLLKNGNPEDIIFLSITTFTSFLTFKILKRKYPQTVISFLHGDIDFLYNSQRRIDTINGFVHKIIFKIKAPNFYYCILNKISKSRLVKDGYLKNQELMEIDHPVEAKKEASNKNNTFKKMVVGHLGSLELERKQSHLFYKTAAYFKTEILKNQIVFNAIGLSTPSMKDYKNEFVNELTGNESVDKPKYLDRITYENELSKLSYAIFFYPEKEYVFRASGAITDAIALNIPIIALRHPFFDYLFNLGGDIGYLCESLDEVINTINNILENKTHNSEIYLEQVNNLKKLYLNFNIESVSKDFKLQCKDRNLI